MYPNVQRKHTHMKTTSIDTEGKCCNDQVLALYLTHYKLREKHNGIFRRHPYRKSLFESTLCPILIISTCCFLLLPSSLKTRRNLDGGGKEGMTRAGLLKINLNKEYLLSLGYLGGKRILKTTTTLC